MPDQLLPHQIHRALGTVEKTPEHIERVKAAQKREKKKDSDRSPKWPATRRKFLKTVKDGCAACGAKQGLQVHHIKPFHSFPKLELDPTNLIALCEVTGGLECHQTLGHGGSFHKFNPTVREDAAALRASPDKLRSIQSGAKKRAIPNQPKG